MEFHHACTELLLWGGLAQNMPGGFRVDKNGEKEIKIEQQFCFFGTALFVSNPMAFSLERH